MKNLFKRISKREPQGPQFPTSIFCHEYNSDVRLDKPHDHRTALLVVFDGNTQRHFSSVKFVVYSDTLEMHKWLKYPLITGQEKPSAISLGNPAPRNDPILTQITITFKLVPSNDCGFYYDLASPQFLSGGAGPGAESSRGSLGHVLLESEYPITSNTSSFSVTFTHSTVIRNFPQSSLPSSGRYFFPSQNYIHDYMTARVVRVIPVPSSADHRTQTQAVCHLPTELLWKTFEACRIFELPDALSELFWQRDLLSFAQVCRQWSTCAMGLLCARLRSLDVCALAHAFKETSILGLRFQDLDLEQHTSLYECPFHHDARKKDSSFLPALSTVLGVTDNLQYLHLWHMCSSESEAKAFFSALPKLPNLRTLSISSSRNPGPLVWPPRQEAWWGSVSTIELAKCMVSWPTLTSVTVNRLRTVTNSTAVLCSLRPGMCALKQLCIRNCWMSDEELLCLAAPSIDTLAHVSLDCVNGLTEEGFGVFLDMISRNGTSITFGISEFEPPRKSRRRLLGALVDKMRPGFMCHG